jgi:hypothetical protein
MEARKYVSGVGAISEVSANGFENIMEFSTASSQTVETGVSARGVAGISLWDDEDFWNAWAVECKQINDAKIIPTENTFRPTIRRP